MAYYPWQVTANKRVLHEIESNPAPKVPRHSGTPATPWQQAAMRVVAGALSRPLGASRLDRPSLRVPARATPATFPRGAPTCARRSGTIWRCGSSPGRCAGPLPRPPRSRLSTASWKSCSATAAVAATPRTLSSSAWPGRGATKAAPSPGREVARKPGQ